MQVQFDRFLNLDDCEVVDNAEWLMGLGYINFLRDVGRHFSVNKMMTAEGIKQRLERNQGLSFIEFNYHLLQSYDFLVLHDKYGCTLSTCTVPSLAICPMYRSTVDCEAGIALSPAESQ